MLDKMRQDSIRFVLSLWDEERGGFRFAHGNEVTLMGTAYALHALEFLGHLNQVTDADKKKMISFIMSGCQGDGTFRDMLFKEEMIATQEHDVEYFEGETTCFCQQALDILGHISPSRKFPKKVLSKKKLLSEFDSYDWKNPHLNSNRVMFWLAQFVFEIERHSRNELIPLVDAALDWIDDNQSKLTGLWKGNLPVSLSAAMAGTFHFTFFYFYRHRPLLFLNRIIDSCIKLQRDDGLFSRNQDVGQTCLDYDALDLLAKASLVSDYRQDILDNVFQKAREPLKELLNSDGGFANCKFRTLKNQKQTFVAKYHTGLEICSCDTSESNSFSTWFRMLALVLTYSENEIKKSSFVFRRLPWLGYHDIDAIKRSYRGNSTNNKANVIKGFQNIKLVEGLNRIYTDNNSNEMIVTFDVKTCDQTWVQINTGTEILSEEICSNSTLFFMFDINRSFDIELISEGSYRIANFEAIPKIG